MDTLPPITVTKTDLLRLRKCMSSQGVHAVLDEELERAAVVAATEAPPTLVTMNSRVVFEDVLTSRQREVTLVYPEEADAERGRVSVFSPVGAALIGLSVGQEIEWALPQGRTARFRIEAVTYQPEASGDYHL